MGNCFINSDDEHTVPDDELCLLNHQKRIPFLIMRFNSYAENFCDAISRDDQKEARMALKKYIHIFRKYSGWTLPDGARRYFRPEIMLAILKLRIIARDAILKNIELCTQTPSVYNNSFFEIKHRLVGKTVSCSG